MRRKVQGEDEKKVRQDVLDIALKNHLVSRYTSLVAVDVTPVRVKEELLRRQALKGVLPAGYSNKTVTLARTATSSRWYLLLGILSIIMALVIAMSSRFELPGRFR
jgi:Ca-activated chloride channel family protein